MPLSRHLLGAASKIVDHVGMTQLTGKVEQLLEDARAIATERGHELVGTEHVLLAMTRQSDESLARRLLNEAGVTEDLQARVESVIGSA